MKFEKVSRAEWVKAVSKFNNPNLEVEYDDLIIPTRKTASSAGYDFYAPYDFEIAPNSKLLIPTGIKAQIDSDKVLMIAPRSSIGIKHGIRMSNTQGYIDSDYYNNIDNEGHIFIELENTKMTASFKCTKGDRFVQGIILKYFTTEDDNSTEIRTGGIGSTGK